ncbi:MAG: hypothetical protein L3J77_03575 [Thermoplasmata archaeon]|nr:hypothetical protein [Thermoplasmata archaeon]
MTGDFGAIEGVVAVVGAAAAGTAFALRLLRASPLETGVAHSVQRWFRRAAPALFGLIPLVSAAWLFGGAVRGLAFDQGLLIGLVAAAAVATLGAPGESDGPGPADRPLPVRWAAGGVGASGLALLAVLAVLLWKGSGPPALLGLAVGPAILLFVGEPANRFDLRLRFGALVAVLSCATAFVPQSVILRLLLPDALLLPLLAATLGTVAGLAGLLFDRIEGPYALGAPAAAGTGVVLGGYAVVTWIPADAAVVFAVAAGWLAALTAMYLPRWAVYEPAATAAAAARAGVALGVIGSMGRGLRTAVGAVLAFAVPLLIADAAIRSITLDGVFGVLLAASTAATAALVLGGTRVGAGPRGSPRRVPEVLDVVATGWAGLAVAFALPVLAPPVAGLSVAVLGEQLAVGNPATLGGLVLGAVAPFLLASATTDWGGSAWARATAVAAAAALAVVVGVLLGPSALVGLALGAALTAIPLGLFWATSREASASLQLQLEEPSADRSSLASAFDAASGWRIAAAVLAIAAASLAVAATIAPASGALGL